MFNEEKWNALVQPYDGRLLDKIMEKPITQKQAISSLEVGQSVRFLGFDQPEKKRISVLTTARLLRKEVDGFSINTKIEVENEIKYVVATRVG